VDRDGESTGQEVNMTYPHAWRYRDYVIDSFNADKPFDQFVKEQIAGDLIPVITDEDWAENLVATTFLAMGPKNVNENNPVQFAANVVDEQIDATTRIFLGMSVACARCHDHKFDPIPQTDYYAMAGLFQNMTTYFGNPPSEFGAFSSAQSKRNSSSRSYRRSYRLWTSVETLAVTAWESKSSRRRRTLESWCVVRST
jgi:hypothetical protein